MATPIRHDWTREEVLELYRKPFADLVFQAAQMHREFNRPNEVQRATLLSVKTGGCQENCSYCPQSAHYETGVERQSLMSVDQVREAASRAKANGADRFCMGAAWRQVKDGPEFDRVLDMVKAVSETGLEACATLGMLSPDQARRLKEAGLTAYNHNLDSSAEFYSKIITTRKYQDRLDTLERVRDAGLDVCCGGIIGMGESVEDRCGLLAQLASFDPHPDSVPINTLVAVEGTPLEEQKKNPVDPLDFVRMVAVARIVMPRSRVRLSAGRLRLSREAQALAFLAGANSIFSGEKLLTTANPDVEEDAKLLSDLGMTSVAPGATLAARRNAPLQSPGHEVVAGISV
jgi:biotin synthase